LARNEKRLEGLSESWDLKRYLKSLGLAHDEADAWIRAREGGETFQSDGSDGVGHHLDRVWGRSLQSLLQLDARSQATGQLTRVNEQHAHLNGRFAVWRSIAVILWGYCTAVWLYVISFQMVNPDSPYWKVAVWLPIRMDYFGESAFVASFIFAIMWARLG
jgi:hypothetical protein